MIIRRAITISTIFVLGCAVVGSVTFAMVKPNISEVKLIGDKYSQLVNNDTKESWYPELDLQCIGDEPILKLAKYIPLTVHDIDVRFYPWGESGLSYKSRWDVVGKNHDELQSQESAGLLKYLKSPGRRPEAMIDIYFSDGQVRFIKFDTTGLQRKMDETLTCIK